MDHQHSRSNRTASHEPVNHWTTSDKGEWVEVFPALMKKCKRMELTAPHSPRFGVLHGHALQSNAGGVLNRFEVPRHPNGGLITRKGSSPFAQRWALAISMAIPYPASGGGVRLEVGGLSGAGASPLHDAAPFGSGDRYGGPYGTGRKDDSTRGEAQHARRKAWTIVCFSGNIARILVLIDAKALPWDAGWRPHTRIPM